MSILEVFLAIALIYIVFSQVQIQIPARYSDTANIERLHRYSHDIAFSLCGNLKAKRLMINNTLLTDLNSSVPLDVCYKLQLYKNITTNHILDTLAYEYASCSYPASSVPKTTSTCLIAGGPNATNYSTTSCALGGGSCLDFILKSDDSTLNVQQNQNITIGFDRLSNGSIVELILEGRHNTSGTTYLYNLSNYLMASYNFSTTVDEIHIFDLTEFFPPSTKPYNITIKPNVNATYDYAYLNVSRNVYSPRRVVVSTWNAGG